MTRKEARKRLEVYLICAQCPEDKECYDSSLHSTCEYNDCREEVSLAEAIRTAIKALEQEPILDKIGAEIDIARFIDKDTKLCKNANASGLEVALQIIDKYRGEVDCRECKAEYECYECKKYAENEVKEMKTDTHIVIKKEDIFEYLTGNQIKNLDAVLTTIADGRKKDGKKTDNSYYICNTDEPYADEVLDVILKAESEASNDKI